MMPSLRNLHQLDSLVWEPPQVATGGDCAGSVLRMQTAGRVATAADRPKRWAGRE